MFEAPVKLANCMNGFRLLFIFRCLFQRRSLRPQLNINGLPEHFDYFDYVVGPWACNERSVQRESISLMIVTMAL